MARKRQHDESANAALNDIAAGLRCSITASLMCDPVMTCDGQCYERAAISEWLGTHDTSPNTGKKLPCKDLTPAPAVRSTVERLVTSGCLAPEETRQWQLQQALRHLEGGRPVDARPLLEQALAAGEAAAGYHLARLLLIDAASAGVPEAVALTAHFEADGARSAAVPKPLASMRRLEVGERVWVLPRPQLEAACASTYLDSDELCCFCGKIGEVMEKDASDRTLLLRLQHRAESDWDFFRFPLAACSRLDASIPHRAGCRRGGTS